jgi:hypothetical protein
MEASPLNKRLDRFVRRYVGSPISLSTMYTSGRDPDRFYTLGNLQHFVSAPLPDVDMATLELEHRGLVQTRRRGDGVRVSLFPLPHREEGTISLYALTADVSTRRAVEDTPLTRSECSRLLRHSVRQRVIRNHRHDSQPAPNVTEETLKGGTP